MEFIDELNALSKTVTNLSPKIQTEEATKTSFIMPFFKALGYDVFNPLEFVPECVADVGVKKGEKVDYAILIDNNPVILIEAKWCGETLDKHGSQLFRYFATSKAKFGILTNGIEYRFYTDLDKPNVMDTKPFFVFDITKISEQDVVELKKFHKSRFDVNTVFSAAEESKYTNQINRLLNRQLNEPEDNFINYILNEIYDGRRTHATIERFKPIITKSITQFVNDLISDRLTIALNKSKEAAEETAEKMQAGPPEEEPEEKQSKIITTIDELEAYAIIKAILRDIIPADRIFYRDTVNYFGVLVDNKNYKWICRLKVEKANKYIIFPDESHNGKSYPLESVNNIFDYSSQIIESAKRFIETDQ